MSSQTLSRHSDFPFTFSWSTSPAETMKSPTSYTQHIPNDVWRFDDLDILPTPLATVLDQTTLQIDFDHSCLEGLDDELLVSPIDAYAAICWAAIDEADNPPSRSTFRRFNAIRTNRTEDGTPSSDESGSDTDECRTFNDDVGGLLPIQHFNVNAHEPKIPQTDTKSHYYTSFEATQQIFAFEQRFLHFDPAESIGLSPVPPKYHHQKSKSSSFAALRTYLPLGRKKSTSAT